MTDDAEYEELYGIPRIYRATGSCAKAVKVCEDLANEKPPVCSLCGGPKEVGVPCEECCFGWMEDCRKQINFCPTKPCPCQGEEATDAEIKR